MDVQELIDISQERNVKINLHLPDYEGRDLILVGGAITTEYDFGELNESLCHLFEDGRILRYRSQIGTFEDIEVMNIVDGIVIQDIKDLE